MDALREALGKHITQGFYPADDAITRVACTICESLGITWANADGYKKLQCDSAASVFAALLTLAGRPKP